MEGRAVSEQSVDRTACQGTRGGGPREGGCQGRGGGRAEGSKGQRGAAGRAAERGGGWAGLELSVRQTQGLHYGGRGAGTAARVAP